MDEVTFRPTRWGDLRRVRRGMAAIDRLECAAFGLSPGDALLLGVRGSIICWTGLMGGKAEAIFGVQPASLMDRLGRPWLLGTDRARSCARLWLTLAPVYLAQIEHAFPALENHVHADNRRAIRWLQRLGFDVSPELVHIGGEPMRRFTKGL